VRLWSPPKILFGQLRNRAAAVKCGGEPVTSLHAVAAATTFRLPVAQAPEAFQPQPPRPPLYVMAELQARASGCGQSWAGLVRDATDDDDGDRAVVYFGEPIHSGYVLIKRAHLANVNHPGARAVEAGAPGVLPQVRDRVATRTTTLAAEVDGGPQSRTPGRERAAAGRCGA